MNMLLALYSLAVLSLAGLPGSEASCSGAQMYIDADGHCESCNTDNHIFAPSASPAERCVLCGLPGRPRCPTGPGCRRYPAGAFNPQWRSYVDADNICQACDTYTNNMNVKQRRCVPCGTKGKIPCRASPQPCRAPQGNHDTGYEDDSGRCAICRGNTHNADPTNPVVALRCVPCGGAAQPKCNGLPAGAACDFDTQKDCFSGECNFGGTCNCQDCRLSKTCPGGCAAPLICGADPFNFFGRKCLSDLGGRCAVDTDCESFKCEHGACVKGAAGVPCVEDKLCISGHCGFYDDYGFCDCTDCTLSPSCPSGCPTGQVCHHTSLQKYCKKVKAGG